MAIPNADRASIASEKLLRYLLSPEESAGKAEFFSRFGYTRANWQQLAADLRQFHLTADDFEELQTKYGQKFVIRAPINTPSGETVDVVSAWMIDIGRDTPRFITAYPGRKRR